MFKASGSAERGQGQKRWAPGLSRAYSKVDGQCHLLPSCWSLLSPEVPPAGRRSGIRPQELTVYFQPPTCLFLLREKASPLLLLGSSPAQMPVSEEARTQGTAGMGVQRSTCCPRKRGPSSGQPKKSAYHPDCWRSKGPHQNVGENSPKKSDVPKLPGHWTEFKVQHSG